MAPCRRSAERRRAAEPVRARARARARAYCQSTGRLSRGRQGAPRHSPRATHPTNRSSRASQSPGASGLFPKVALTHTDTACHWPSVRSCATEPDRLTGLVLRRPLAGPLRLGAGLARIRQLHTSAKYFGWSETGRGAPGSPTAADQCVQAGHTPRAPAMCEGTLPIRTVSVSAAAVRGARLFFFSRLHARREVPCGTSAGGSRA